MKSTRYTTMDRIRRSMGLRSRNRVQATWTLVAFALLAACFSEDMPMRAEAISFFETNRDQFEDLRESFQASEYLVVRRHSRTGVVTARLGDPPNQIELSGTSSVTYDGRLAALSLNRIEKVEGSSGIRLWPSNSIVDHRPVLHMYYLHAPVDSIDAEACSNNLDFETSGFCQINVSESWWLYYYW